MERERKSQAGLHSVGKTQAVTIIEVNTEPTPLTHGEISDYLIQGKTGDVLPRIVDEVKQLKKR